MKIATADNGPKTASPWTIRQTAFRQSIDEGRASDAIGINPLMQKTTLENPFPIVTRKSGADHT